MKVKMKITRRQLRRIIKEYKKGALSKNHVDGQPWSGSLEDLATAQGNTWGGGTVVDPQGWKDNIKMGGHWTKGTARSANAKKLNEVENMRITKRQLKRIVKESLKEAREPADPSYVRNALTGHHKRISSDRGGFSGMTANQVLDALWVDDLWPEDEAALEQMLSSVNAKSIEDLVPTVTDWLNQFRSGGYATEDQKQVHLKKWSR